jgi:hypothetical protein
MFVTSNCEIVGYNVKVDVGSEIFLLARGTYAERSEQGLDGWILPQPRLEGLIFSRSYAAAAANIQTPQLQHLADIAQPYRYLTPLCLVQLFVP